MQNAELAMGVLGPRARAIIAELSRIGGTLPAPADNGEVWRRELALPMPQEVGRLAPLMVYSADGDTPQLKLTELGRQVAELIEEDASAR